MACKLTTMNKAKYNENSYSGDRPTMRKSLFILPILSILTLSSCNLITDLTTPGDELPINMETAKANLKTLADSTGFEVTFRGSSKDSESEEQSGEMTVSMRGNVIWFYSEEEEMNGGALLTEDNKTVSFTFDEESDKYIGHVTSETREDYDAVVDSMTSSLLAAGAYDGMPGFHKRKELTYCDREATEYSFDFTVLMVKLKFTVIVDNELGITLYLDMNAKVYVAGEEGRATFEVLDFKTNATAPEVEIVEPTPEE